METAGGNRGMAGDVSFNREPQLEGLTEKEVKELYAVLKRFLEAYREGMAGRLLSEGAAGMGGRKD